MTLLLAVNTVKVLKSCHMVEIVGRDGQKLNELQSDVTGYMLAGVIWRSGNEPPNTWWVLWCPLLKILL